MSLIEGQTKPKTIPQRVSELMSLAIEVNAETDYAVSTHFDGRTDEFKIVVTESKNNLANELAVASIRLKAFPFELDNQFHDKLIKRINQIEILLRNTIRSGKFDVNGLSRQEPDFELMPYRF